MKTNTAQKLNSYLLNIAEDNNVDYAAVMAGRKFTIEPTVQQKLETAVLESSEFLGMINVITVDDQMGQTLKIGVSGPIASRTNTNANDRQTKSIHTLAENSYFCSQTNFDSHITYAELDAWAKFPDFAARVGNVKAQRIALDRIMIGFNGEKAEKETNITTYPLLQDVNKGWLQLVKEKAPEKVMKEEHSGTNTIEIGTNKTYANLDALVFSMKEDFIAAQYRNDSKLVAIMSSDLLADKYFPLINDSQATEQLAADTIISQKRVGGLRAVSVPFFPKGTVLVTSLDNLSIYVQEGKMRRAIIDNPRRDRIEDFLSSNEAYVVENYDAIALATNIKIIDAPAKKQD
ncbi:phage major capsid protein, P2 family [Lonepinella sp. BR2919]|uniref:phage major capsid protein, P2 family n=1 Tax=unclassified Lonepinella TaxID=2642006 RepID=UPI003F6E2094